MPGSNPHSFVPLFDAQNVLVSTRADLGKTVWALQQGHTDLISEANVTVISASNLKTTGISDIERSLRDEDEVVISVRGKPRYVMMDLARYYFLRECEIAAAWAQTREDVSAGCYRREGADARMTRFKAEPADVP